MTTTRTKVGVAALIVASIVGGGIASKTLLESTSAIRSLTAVEQSAEYGKLQARVHAAALKPGTVPFLGPYAYHVKGVRRCGPSVRIMEGALRRTVPPIRKTPPSNCFGAATRLQVKLLQKRNALPQTGIYGLSTHKKLSKRYTRVQIRDLSYLLRNRVAAARLLIVVKQRAAIVTITGHAKLIGDGTLPYTQGPSRSNLPAWPRIPPATDCSGYATWVLWQAGEGPRVGYFGVGSPVGWTGTLEYQGKAVGTNMPLQPGDLIFYGHPIGHVAVYIGHGLVSSHGGRGISTFSYTYRTPTMIRRYIF